MSQPIRTSRLGLKSIPAGGAATDLTAPVPDAQQWLIKAITFAVVGSAPAPGATVTVSIRDGATGTSRGVTKKVLVTNDATTEMTHLVLEPTDRLTVTNTHATAAVHVTAHGLRFFGFA